MCFGRLVPHLPRHCLTMPLVAGHGQSLPGVAPQCQSLPLHAAYGQSVPGVAPRCQAMPKLPSRPLPNGRLRGRAKSPPPRTTGVRYPGDFATSPPFRGMPSCRASRLDVLSSPKAVALPRGPSPVPRFSRSGAGSPRFRRWSRRAARPTSSSTLRPCQKPDGRTREVFCYNGQLPGPVIRVKEGERLRTNWSTS